ncbi:MAG: Gfo/Idh/MocA family oxidoreductase [Pseudomonadota bacterium]
MKEPIRLGILGCGVITQRTMQALLALLEEFDGRIVGICDPNDANVAAVESMAAGHAPQRFADLETMASVANAIVVATPIRMHFEHVHTALNAGCHVYTHKTLAATEAQCMELAGMAERGNRKLVCSPGQLLLPAYRKALAIVESGELGRIVSVDAAAEASPHRYEAERADENPAAGQAYSWEWYHRKDRGGGPVDDMFVYPLAFLVPAFGRATAAAVNARLIEEAIEWRGRTVTADTPDAYSGYMQFGPVVSTVRASFSSNTSRISWGMITIRGSRACLEIDKRNDLEYRLYVTANGEDSRVEECNVFDTAEAARFGRAECHVIRDMRELFEAIRNDRAVEGATPENAAAVAGAISLMHKSAASGGELTAA